MNANQTINVLNLDLYMSKYKSYCIPSDFFENIQSVDNSIMIINSSPSTIKTGFGCASFKQRGIFNFFMLLVYYMLSTCLTLNIFWSKVKKNLLLKMKRVKDLSTKRSGFHAVSYSIFQCRGYTYSKFLL